jgi:hypothetical protein
MERRLYSRHPHNCAIIALQSSTGGYTVAGSVVDLSERGACVLVNRALDPLTVLPWRLHTATPVPLPVLAQVRWVRPEGEDRFRMGLLFVA